MPPQGPGRWRHVMALVLLMTVAGGLAGPLATRAAAAQRQGAAAMETGAVERSLLQVGGGDACVRAGGRKG